MRRFKLAAAITLVVVLGGWAAFHHRSAEARTRRYFGMGYFAPLDSASIERAAVLRIVPVGTTEAKVREFLSKRGIGADGMSSYSPPGIDHQAVVRIEFDPASLSLVKRHFSVLMRFNDESRLERVQAKDWLTGP